MFKTRKQDRGAGLAVCAMLLVSALGCQSLHLRRDIPVEQPAVPTVNVGGLVSNPGPIELKSGIRTISDILALAGGPVARTKVIPSRPSDRQLIAFTDSAKNHLSQFEALAKKILDENPGVKVPETNADMRDLIGIQTILQGEKSTIERRLEDHILDTQLRTQLIDGLDKGFEGFLGNAVPGSETAYSNFTRVGVSQQAFDELKSGIESFQQAVERVRVFLSNEVAAEVGLQNVSAAAVTDDLFVSLKRGNSDAGNNYVFPWAFVNNGPAGAVQVSDGDMITVKELSDTVLTNPVSRSGNQIALTGFVRNPGRHLVGNMLNLGKVSQSTGLAGIAQTDQFCLVLKRASADQMGTDTYILPHDAVVTGSLQSVPMMAQDEISLVPFFQAPLIADALIGSRVKTALVSRVNQLEERQAPAGGYLDKTQRNIGKFVQAPVASLSNLWQRGAARIGRLANVSAP